MSGLGQDEPRAMRIVVALQVVAAWQDGLEVREGVALVAEVDEPRLALGPAFGSLLRVRNVRRPWQAEDPAHVRARRVGRAECAHYGLADRLHLREPVRQ